MALISIVFNNPSIQELVDKYCTLEITEAETADVEVLKRYLTREWKKAVHLNYTVLQGKEVTLTTFEEIHKGNFVVLGGASSKHLDIKNSILKKKQLHKELLHVLSQIESMTERRSSSTNNFSEKIDNCMRLLNTAGKNDSTTKLHNTLLLIKQQLHG